MYLTSLIVNFQMLFITKIAIPLCVIILFQEIKIYPCDVLAYLSFKDFCCFVFISLSFLVFIDGDGKLRSRDTGIMRSHNSNKNLFLAQSL